MCEINFYVSYFDKITRIFNPTKCGKHLSDILDIHNIHTVDICDVVNSRNV